MEAMSWGKLGRVDSANMLTTSGESLLACSLAFLLSASPLTSNPDSEASRCFRPSRGITSSLTTRTVMTFIKNQAKSLTSDNYHNARSASAGLVLSGESLHASGAHNLVGDMSGQKCNL
jgi:hypothetical protein